MQFMLNQETSSGNPRVSAVIPQHVMLHNSHKLDKNSSWTKRRLQNAES